MVKRSILISLLSAVFVFCFLRANTQNNFFAYHTNIHHTSTDYVGKYADIVVSIDDHNQLEFARRDNYQPKWQTASGAFLIDEFYPEKKQDFNFYYSYVRLIENTQGKIVIHRRYVPDIDKLEEANKSLNSTNIEGFTNVIHEIYTIYPTGKIERRVKDGRNTLYDNWISEDFGHFQELMLKNDGIEYGKVKWNTAFADFQIISGNEIKSSNGLSNTVISFKFDEGAGIIPDSYIDDEEFELEYNATFEYNTAELCEIMGHGSTYKKGVSGAALVFDGYYTGLSYAEDFPVNKEFSIEAWLALDVYPFNKAPIMQKSKKFGASGFYLGIDPYGKVFFKVNGTEIKSKKVIPLYTWTQIAASIGKDTIKLYVDGEKVGEENFNGEVILQDVPLTIGLNTEMERGSDYVRDLDQNIPFIYGIQGLLDEVKVYDEKLSEKQVEKSYEAYLPSNRVSDLKKGILPGEVGQVGKFGAKYKTLVHHEPWDRMWRLTDDADIVVKFEDYSGSVVYWHGTNYAANWVTENNIWMSDQSSEIFEKHGCAEHMADKQNRHSYARIIENNDARVIVHWRYPCVDVGYKCSNKMNWTDEYHTIYPDGTGIRKVYFNNKSIEQPGFQDLQLLTNPGQSALDVVDLVALSVANTEGDILDLEWEKPNKNPDQKIKNATIELINTKSENKVFALHLGGEITTWGDFEQSKFTDDPFAGPWNHWPISIIPSDGRYAITDDRVTHFALASNDGIIDNGSMVQYGLTKKPISALIPLAKYWQDPPVISNIRGGVNNGFVQEEKAYYFADVDNSLSFTVDASEESPLINPCFVLVNASLTEPDIKINGKSLERENIHLGYERDSNGSIKTVIWLKLEQIKKLTIHID